MTEDWMSTGRRHIHVGVARKDQTMIDGDLLDLTSHLQIKAIMRI